MKSPFQKSSSSTTSFLLELFSGFSFVVFLFYRLGCRPSTFCKGSGSGICGLVIFCYFRSIFSSNKSSFAKNLFSTALMSVILSRATFICRYLFSSAYFFYLTASNSSSASLSYLSCSEMEFSFWVISWLKVDYLEARSSSLCLRCCSWCLSSSYLSEEKGTWFCTRSFWIFIRGVVLRLRVFG